MQLDVIPYESLLDRSNTLSLQQLEMALLQKGIVGIRGVPQFERKSRAYVQAAREFSALLSHIKQQYEPNRAIGDTEGYELGAEWFKNAAGEWQIDDKKASFYAVVPDHPRNKWPREVDLRSAYLALGNLIFEVGKLILNSIGLNSSVNLDHSRLKGYGRMLHYHKENAATNANPDWCGAHFDHGVLTGLMPAYYFQNGIEVDEPQEAGLYIIPSHQRSFVKMSTTDKSVLLFQVGEFGQLLSNDCIKATKHMVKKAYEGIERFAFALFYSADNKMLIQSHSKLITDTRYAENQFADGSISYEQWEQASYARYHANNALNSKMIKGD